MIEKCIDHLPGGRALIGRGGIGWQRSLGYAHRAQLQRVAEGDVIAAPDHDLGRSAADIDRHQGRVGGDIQIGVMARGGVDERRFAFPGDDLDRPAQIAGGVDHKCGAIGGVAQGARADGGDKGRAEIAGFLPERGKRGEGSVHGVVVEPPGFYRRLYPDA